MITETGVGMALAGGSLAERRGFGRTVALADGGEVLVRRRRLRYPRVVRTLDGKEEPR